MDAWLDWATQSALRLDPANGSASAFDSSKDGQTVQALFTSRLHVLRGYPRRVIGPVCRHLSKSQVLARFAPHPLRLLILHPEPLGFRGRQESGELLDRYDVPRVVVEIRDRLQPI